jgi:hypothetical protein
VSALVPSWSSAVQASYTTDPLASALLAKLSLDPNAVPHFTLQSSLLRYRNRIWIGSEPIMQRRLITEFHSSAWGGHFGIPVTHS